MSFFDSIPEPPPPEPVQTEQPAWMRSDAVIPGSVPSEILLVRTGEVAVAIGSVRGYPNGFEFTLHTRLRAEDEDGEGPDPFEWHGRRGPRTPGDYLLLRPHSTVELVDRAETAGLVERTPDGEDGRVVRVRLTREGDRVLNKLTRAHLKRLHELATVLDELVSKHDARQGA